MSRLETISKPFRDILVAKNDYEDNDQYNVGHPDAISTGDERGKGKVNDHDQVGGKTVIIMRDRLMGKNDYYIGKEYNSHSA